MIKNASVFITCWVAVGLSTAAVAKAGQSDVIAVMKLDGPLAEQPNQGLAALMSDKAPVSMFDLLQKLRAARKDPNLKAIIFDIDKAALGFAQIQELRAQFDALQAVDKDVWILAESLNMGSLLLGSTAGRLVLVPTGEVDFSGLYGESLYFKNALEKLGIEADIVHCGAFKSAGEPFYRTGPSDEAAEQQNRLLDSIFDQVIEGVAKSRRLTKERVRELIDVGSFSAAEALQAKLVDKLMYREDFVQSLKRRYGDDAKVDSNYGGEKAPEFDLNNPFAIFKLFGDMMKQTVQQNEKPAIAVVYVEGPITTGPTEQGLFGGPMNAGSTTIRKAIAKAAADPNVKALILRVDSPGGSALASDIICEASKRFRESGRPLIVSMGNVAASGGYYVSALADTILAEPGTITGSIGVVGGKMVTKGLWDWLGVTSHEYKRGKHADILNSNRPFSEDERELVMKQMNRIYDEFKGRVIEGREDQLEGEIESLAGGRVYTGAEALKLGLVDRLGGFADAVKLAAAEAELSDYELRVYPEPKSFMDMLAEAFGGKEKEEEFVSLMAGVRGGVGSKFVRLPPFAQALDTLKTLDPRKGKILQDFLVQLELFASERVLLIGPGFTTTMP